MITLHRKGLPRYFRFMGAVLTVLLVILSSFHIVQASYSDGFPQRSTLLSEDSIPFQVYIPIIQKPPLNLSVINVPYFDTVKNHQAAISWFGQVSNHNNYADIRVGYTSDVIYWTIYVIDDYLFYDVNPDGHHLTQWDSITINLDTNGNNGTSLSPSMFSFTRQLEWYHDGLTRQIAYQGSSSGWNEVPITFFTTGSYVGSNNPNDTVEDRGYVLTFQIPFTSLGISKPVDGTEWGASITMHDRDDKGGTIFSETLWPKNYYLSHSSTWNKLSFGLPAFTPPQADNIQTYTIRNGLNNEVVKDGVVGGNTMCYSGHGDDFFTNGWGDYVYPPGQDMNVQNQGNIEDWPCYSKFYIIFPLDSLPNGQTVISASLTLHQSGQSTGFPWDPPEALNSLIQVSVIDQDWLESTLSWNNGPLPIENVSQSWVGAVIIEELGKASTWDLSGAVSTAYAEGIPLRLVVYSADIFGPNGKYFFSSDQEWVDVRPSLAVDLGSP